MPTYPKFSSYEAADKIRDAIVHLHSHRHTVSYHTSRVVNRYLVYASSTMLPKNKKLLPATVRVEGIKKVTNRDCLSWAWLNDEGDVIIGQLVPTLVNSIEERQGGCYISDMVPNWLDTIIHKKMPELIKAYDQLVLENRLTSNPLTDKDNE